MFMRRCVKVRPALPDTRLVRNLDLDLLTLEATGDYAGAKAMLDRLGKLTPELENAIAKLRDIPTDIDPIPVTANAITAGR
jgi:hypothetical protein